MANWKLETAELEPGDEPIEYYRLSLGEFWDLDVMELEDGRFYVEAINNGIDGEIEIGRTDTLEEAKSLAEMWAVDQITGMLRSLGAAGIWLVRGATAATLGYIVDDSDSDPIEIVPSQPHGRLMLVRFPSGDGEEAGIEFYG